MPSMQGALSAADEWVKGRAASPHTERKYRAELQQFCEWMLVRGHDFAGVTTREIDQYLSAVALGQAALDAPHPGRPRTQRTVTLTRSVLKSLFQELHRRGHCTDNPVDLAAHTQSPAPPGQTPRADLLGWAAVRPTMLARAAADSNPRNPLLRAVAIADLAYWAGLRRSELACAVMGDLVAADGTWWLSLRRFARGPADRIEVPPPAMQTLGLYRRGRGLGNFPESNERTVPLIARLRSEHPVQAWAIANALTQLRAAAPATNTKLPAIVDLRKELVARALDAKIDAQALAQHVRSKGAVEQLMKRMGANPIGAKLAELAG